MLVELQGLWGQTPRLRSTFSLCLNLLLLHNKGAHSSQWSLIVPHFTLDLDRLSDLETRPHSEVSSLLPKAAQGSLLQSEGLRAELCGYCREGLFLIVARSRPLLEAVVVQQSLRHHPPFLRTSVHA